jgi:hypothetical protein
MECGNGRQLEGPNEVEHGLAIFAAPDARLELDRDDVRTALERSGRPAIVTALVTPDPVVDLEGVRRNRLERVERNDLAIGRDAAQVTREGGDPAAAGWIARDERGTDDGGAPIEGKRKSGPS